MSENFLKSEGGGRMEKPKGRAVSCLHHTQKTLSEIDGGE